MGQMRFIAPEPDRVTAWAAERAYLAGMDGSPWKSRNLWQDGVLALDRPMSESGNLYLPWQVPGRGQLTVSTTSLREQPTPYHLPLELARGTVNRVRNQASDWRIAGLILPESFEVRLQEATSLFIDAAMAAQQAPDDAADFAERAIHAGYDCIDLLIDEYTRQALALRHQTHERFSTLLAGALERVPPAGCQDRYLAAFNSAALPFRWKDIEPNAGEFHWDRIDEHIQWCHTHGLKVCAGPLLRLDKASLPDWIYLWEDDFDTLVQFIVNFISKTVSRYRGKVHLWHCAARLNTPGELLLAEEQRLRLAVGGIETIRRIDGQTPVVISFDQPWAEYLTVDELDLSPAHFADALIRADLGTSGIGMEINLGYWPGGTLPRDLLDLSRQVDRWSHLGLPLLVVLTAPSQCEPDPRAAGPAQNVSLLDLQRNMDHLLPMLLAKHAVQGVIWNQVEDELEHEFPHAGVFEADQSPKPLLRLLSALRREHLI